MNKPLKKNERRDRRVLNGLSDLVKNRKHPTRDSYFNFKKNLESFDRNSEKEFYTKKEVLDLIIGAATIGCHERDRKYQTLLKENLTENLRENGRQVVTAVVEGVDRKVSHIIQQPIIDTFFNAKRIEVEQAEERARFSVHNIRSILNGITSTIYLYQRNLTHNILQNKADEFVKKERKTLSLQKGQFITYFQQREGRFDSFLRDLMESLSKIKYEIQSQINYQEEMDKIPVKYQTFLEKKKRKLDRIKEVNANLIGRCVDLTKQLTALSNDVTLARQDLERINQSISDNVDSTIRPTRVKLTRLISRLSKQNDLFDSWEDELIKYFHHC